MNAIQVLQFFGLSLFPFFVALAIHLIFKFTSPLGMRRPILIKPGQPDYNWFNYRIAYPVKRFFYLAMNTEKGYRWWKGFWLGIVFTLVSITGYYLGIDVVVPGNSLLIKTNYIFTVGNSTAGPLIGGLIFGWRAGLISGILSAIFRASVPGYSFLRWPTAAALLLCGALSSLISRVLFHNKRPKWYFCILSGIFIETFNILLIFLFNLSNITEAYEILTKFDLYSIFFSALTTSLTSLTIALIEHERILPRKKDRNNVSNKVQTTLFGLCVLGLIILGVSVKGTADAKSYEEYSTIASETVTDIGTDIDLYKPKLFPDEPDDPEIKIEEAKMLNYVDFLTAIKDIPNHHHVTTKGYSVIVASKRLQEASEKALDFINSEEGKTEIEKWEWWDPNYVKLIQEAIENTVIAAPKNYSTFVEYPICVGHKITVNGKWGMSDLGLKSNPTRCDINGYRYVAGFNSEVVDVRGRPICFNICMIPESEVYASSGINFRVALYVDIMVFIAIFSGATYFINHNILRRIQQMDTQLAKIMDGHLDTELHVEGYNEFNNLSDNINLAVGALRNYADDVQHRIDSEMKFARDIQNSAVPTAFPVEKNYNIYAKMETAKEVGGDFYDYIKMNNGRIMVLVADVSGKGVPAALFMMRAKSLIKSLASTDLPLEEIVTITNNELCDENEQGIFVTAWIGILNPNNGELRYINAGHTNPLIKRNGKFEIFKNNHNLVLAAFKDYKFKSEITYLQPGDDLVLYTDGVTEANNNLKELYGEKRLLDLVNNANYFNAKQLLDEISDDVVKFADGEEQFDDMTMLILRFLGNTDKIVPETAITLKARPTNATIAVNFVESILAKFELSPTFIARISICIDELFANIAFYAYPENYIGEATIEVDLRQDVLYINLIDSGKPFDPTAPRKTNLSENIDERERGGLGIFIVKKTMDEMKYEYKDNKNMLKLTKKLDEGVKNNGKPTNQN